jgi:hypothetical protein
LCGLYHDRHGLAVACLRIGSFRWRPTTRRELSTWLSVGGAIRLIDACLRTSDLGFAIVYGISNNTRARWDLAPGRAGSVVISWESQITDRHEGGLMNVKLQWYPVKDGGARSGQRDAVRMSRGGGWSDHWSVSSCGATHRVFATSATAPFDVAERWAADIEATPSSEVDELDGRYVGGAFARPDQPRPIPRP